MKMMGSKRRKKYTNDENRRGKKKIIGMEGN